MSRIPWTKFQDFYLRLGFLKVLVAALSPQRRSATNDEILRRLESPLFDPARTHSKFWLRIGSRMSWYEDEPDDWTGKKKKHPTTAEALLVDGDCSSFLFAITDKTTYKIIDWARDVEFIGRANQITERGLLLRYLIPENVIDRFLGGNVEAWNPFLLSPSERIFFLFHLIEIDDVMLELIEALGKLEDGRILEAREAAQLTCAALITVLTKARSAVQPRDILAFRTACELAGTIAEELDMTDQAGELVGGPRRRTPKPLKPVARRSLSVSGQRLQPRRTTKNADHQTIPRFEQLVDLGFLEKPIDETGGEQAAFAGRRRWRYLPSATCRRWVAARAASEMQEGRFKWEAFATTFLKTFTQEAGRSTAAPSTVARYLWQAYERIRRPAGPNPLDSIALYAMIEALTNGVAIEMADFHRLMLRIKQRSALPDHAFFASGNDLDQMFIQLKPGFVQEVEKNEAILSTVEQT